MDKYYLDTSIWLDYYEKRGNNGVSASKLIRWLIEKDFIIIYSDLHIKELKALNYSQMQINEIFNIPKSSKIIKVHVSRQQLEEARIISSRRKVPHKDALHAVLSRDNEAILVFTDRHFERLKEITISKHIMEFI